MRRSLFLASELTQSAVAYRAHRLIPACAPLPSLASPQPVKTEELAARISTQLRMCEAQKLQSDAQVLRTMLPTQIVSRLGRGETDIADAHENVTILFSGANDGPARATRYDKSEWERSLEMFCGIVKKDTSKCRRQPVMSSLEASLNLVS